MPFQAFDAALGVMGFLGQGRRGGEVATDGGAVAIVDELLGHGGEASRCGEGGSRCDSAP